MICDGVMIMVDNNMSIQIWALNIDAIFIANLVNGLWAIIL